MRKAISRWAAVVCALCLPAAAQERIPYRDDPVFFSLDWCPLAAEVKELEKTFVLVRNGCCIHRADRLAWDKAAMREALNPFLLNVTREPQHLECRGDNEELATARKAAVQAKAEEEAQRAKEIAAQRRELPAQLRTVPVARLCAGIGRMLRGEDPEYFAPLVGKESLSAAKAEARRRGLAFDEVRARAEKMRVGDTLCHLWAAWGLAGSVNRTVTSRSVSMQLVYGDTYVYSDGVRVTAWQD